jgi:REP element-mobilizing transposase RayT
MPIAFGEWYHCYNRGVDKRIVFKTRGDHERFVTLLYTSNGDMNVPISNKRDARLQTILSDLSFVRGTPLVEIGAYSLMPNHVHLLLHETREGGIARFMQKVFTAYTMYFNLRYQRTGALFSGSFKSRHIQDDDYLKTVVPYILLNPVVLEEPAWKKGVGNPDEIEKVLAQYPHSSLLDFCGVKRLENKIISPSIYEYFDKIPTVTKMLREAKAWHTLQA